METAIRTNVYFLQACQGGPVKIGQSQNVERRLADIQPGHPFKLQVARLFENVDPAFEAWLHRRFADHRLHGEWFDETVMTLADTEDLRSAFESGRSAWWTGIPADVHVTKNGYDQRFRGYEIIEKEVAGGGNSGRVFVPKAWVGKHVKIVLLEPLEEGDPDA